MGVATGAMIRCRLPTIYHHYSLQELLSESGGHPVLVHQQICVSITTGNKTRWWFGLWVLLCSTILHGFFDHVLLVATFHFDMLELEKTRMKNQTFDSRREAWARLHQSSLHWRWCYTPVIWHSNGKWTLWRCISSKKGDIPLLCYFTRGYFSLFASSSFWISFWNLLTWFSSFSKGIVRGRFTSL